MLSPLAPLCALSLGAVQSVHGARHRRPRNGCGHKSAILCRGTKWRSVKYEEVYLRAYDSVAEARRSIGCYLAFYNRKRPHSSLNGRTPDQAYFGGLTLAEAA